MVLVVVAIAGTFLAAIARRSCGLALRAGSDLEDLQVRWGLRGCEAVALPAAEDLLVKATLPGVEPPRQTRCSVTLGGLPFQMIVGDEQAKANANLLARLRGQTALATALTKLQAGLSRQIAVQLRPTPSAPGVADPPPPFAAYDQLVALKHPSELVGAAGAASFADRVTCWGSGALNLARAEKAVLDEVLNPLLTASDLAKIATLRQSGTGFKGADLPKLLALSPEKAKELGQLVTQGSKCHSLWAIAQGRTRNWYRLSVTTAGNAKAGPTTLTFEW